MKKIIQCAVGTALLMTSVNMFAGQEIERKFKKNIRSAKMAVKQQNFEKAFTMIDPILEIHPDNIEMLVFKGDIYYSLANPENEKNIADLDQQVADENFTNAYKCYVKALEEHAKPENAPEKRKERKTREKQIEGISINLVNVPLMYFNASIKAKDSDVKMSYDAASKAMKYIAKFELPEDAKKKLVKQYTQIKDNAVKLMLNAAKAMKDEEKIMAAYEMMMIANPEDATIPAVIATNNFNNKNYEEAAKWYAKASEIAPENEDYIFNLGVTYQNLEQPAKALEEFERAVALNPKNQDAIKSVVSSAFQAKDFDKTLTYQEKLITVNPSKDNYEMATLYAIQGKKYQKAVDFGLKWLEVDAENANVYKFLYTAYKQLGDEKNEEKYKKLYISKM